MTSIKVNSGFRVVEEWEDDTVNVSIEIDNSGLDDGIPFAVMPQVKNEWGLEVAGYDLSWEQVAALQQALIYATGRWKPIIGGRDAMAKVRKVTP